MPVSGFISALLAEHLWFQARLFYWSMMILVLSTTVWGLTQLIKKRDKFRIILREYTLGFVLSCALGATCIILVPPEMRVQWDETDLFSTSQSMHFLRLDSIPFEALPRSDGRLSILEWRIDKRPPLYPFLVSLLHDIRGSSLSNAFAINSIILLFWLNFLFALVQSQLGLLAGIGSQFAVLSSPIFILSASSSGFELLSSTLLAIVIFLSYRFIKAPSHHKLLPVLIAGTWYAYSRYESILILGSVLITCWALVRKRWKIDGRSARLLALLPLAITPLIFIAVLSNRSDSYIETAGAPLFSFEYAMNHFPVFLEAFFYPRFGHPFTGLLNTIAMCVIIVQVARRRWRQEIILTFVPLGFLLNIVLFHFGGDATNPLSVRYFLPFAITGSLGLVLLKLSIPKRFPSFIFLISSVFIFSIQIFYTHDGQVIERVDSVRDAESLDKLFSKLQAIKNHTLFVSELSPYFIVKGFACILPSRLRRDWSIFQKIESEGKIRSILVLEGAEYVEMKYETAELQALLKEHEFTVAAEKNGELPMRLLRLKMPSK